MADKQLELEIICPDRKFFAGKADMVEFNTTEGYIGIYPEHIPLAVVLSPGTLVIHCDGEEKKAALHTGFARIDKKKVSILAEVCEWPDEIDISRAENAKERAEKRIEAKEEGIDIVRAEAALRRALTRISVKG